MKGRKAKMKIQNIHNISNYYDGYQMRGKAPFVPSQGLDQEIINVITSPCLDMAFGLRHQKLS